MSNEVLDKTINGTTCQYREFIYCMSKQDIVQPGRAISTGTPTVWLEKEQYLNTAPNPDVCVNHHIISWLTFPVISILPWIRTGNAATAAFFPIILRLFAKRQTTIKTVTKLWRTP